MGLGDAVTGAPYPASPFAISHPEASITSLDHRPVTVHDHWVDPVKALQLERVARFTSDLRHASFIPVDRSVPAALLVPPAIPIVASIAGHHVAAVLAHDDRALVLVETGDTRTTVSLAAATPQELHELERTVRELIPTDPTDTLDRIVVWRRKTATGAAVHTNKLVELPTWDDIARNYPMSVRNQLEPIMRLTPPVDHGRLLLWHGLPGTGKTNAALALLTSWRDWCDGHLVTDPERLFEDSSYLLDLLMTESGNSPVASLQGPAIPERRWKLLIAEDTEEFLRSDARARAGAALSRALNATDGVLARGTRVLVLFTTNEERGRLHPAITRPGRCLSVIEFGAFDSHEAGNWLGDGDLTPSPMTLAELYQARLFPEQTRPTRSPISAGQYL